MRTSEWVSLGHPDKTADAISEYILDKLIELDPNVRYALECQIKDDYVSLAGEITTSANVAIGDYQRWAREAFNKVGYTEEYQKKWGAENVSCGNDLIVVTKISQQSPDIAQGVDREGFGDQGVFFGMAENNKYTGYMPLDHYLAKDLGTKLYNNAKENNVGGLDIKTQITISDDNNIEQIIVAIPCLDDEEYKKVQEFVNQWIENEDINLQQFINEGRLIINGTGIYKTHSSVGDSGTTGRKLAVDFYGLNCPVGGGSPWTKDGSKADLSLNMYARYLAKQYLLDNLNFENADKSFCKLSCCIGQKKVLGKMWIVDTEGHVLTEKEINQDVNYKDLISKFELNKPVFFDLNKYGLFSKV